MGNLADFQKGNDLISQFQNKIYGNLQETIGLKNETYLKPGEKMYENLCDRLYQRKISFHQNLEQMEERLKDKTLDVIETSLSQRYLGCDQKEIRIKVKNKDHEAFNEIFQKRRQTVQEKRIFSP